MTYASPTLTILHDKQAVIFDIDGTLVDTRESHLRAWQQVLEEAGVKAAPGQLERLFGKHSDEWVRELLPARHQAEGLKLVRRKNEVFAAHLADLRPFPKARELLLCVKAAGKRLAFATGATRAELRHHLRLLQAEQLADATAYDREVARGKPAPDIYALAARKLAVEPAAAVAVGDSLYDVQAARGAGMACVALLTGGFSAGELLASGAAEVYPAVAGLCDAFCAPAAR
jgi:membrane protein